MAIVFASRHFAGSDAGDLEGDISDELVIMIDLDRCIGCASCELSCKLEHGLPPGPRLIRVIRINMAREDSQIETLHAPLLCQHCEEPHCMEVCPSGAISKDPLGVVSISEDLCVGCGLCLEGCPFGVPAIHPKKRVAVKCDLCLGRVRKGLWPACATKCSMKTIYVGTRDLIKRIAGEKKILGLDQILLGREASPSGRAKGSEGAF